MKYYDSTGKKHKYLAFALLRTFEDKYFKPLKEAEPAPPGIPYLNLEIDNMLEVTIVCKDGNTVNIDFEDKSLTINHDEHGVTFSENIPPAVFGYVKLASKFKRFGKR